MRIGKWLTKERLFMLVILIAIFAMAARTPLDSDFWWHIRAGQASVEGGKPLTQDVFSSTRYGEDWVNHSWLSQVVLYLIYKMGGLRAVSGLVGVLAVGSVWFVYRQFRGTFLVKGITVLLVAMVSSVVWTPRPQTFSLLFLAVVSYVLYIYKYYNRNRLGWMLPVFLLWSNIHAGYTLGLILIAAFIGGELINKLRGWQRDEFINWKQIGTVTGILFAAGLIVLVNPNGIAMWKIPFQTVGVEALQNLIGEWASPDFHQVFQQPFIWMSIIAFGAVGLSKRTLDGVELAAFSIFFYGALVARRNFGPFALVAGPILARHLSSFLMTWQEQVREKWLWLDQILTYQAISEEKIHPRLQAVLNLLTVAVLFLGAVGKWLYVTRPAFIQEAERKMFPVEAVHWIKENKPPGEMFNDYNWGGYLVWHLREYPVFIDGRTDLYGDPILEEYVTIQRGGHDFHHLIEERDIGFLLLREQSFLERLFRDEYQVYRFQNSSIILME